MTSKLCLAAAFCGLMMSYGIVDAAELPRLQRNGQTTQLMVDGKPYLALAGEFHNSSPSSPEYMAPLWDKLARNHVRTAIGVASWELIEPQEGHFDFAAVDDQIQEARAHNMRLVVLWFGAFKNAESNYSPSWVRRDEKRFPRGERDPNAKLKGMGAYFGPNPILNVFSDTVLQADSRAFAALMAHIKKVDRDQTVIMVQVENEVGLRSDSRDRSALGTQAWAQPVPQGLITYFKTHRAELRPNLLESWGRQGFKESGTWAEVFGTDASADEIFMAWAFGRYVDRIAKAGAAEYALPMYANAWLGPTPGSPLPGDYPSGGPVARMLDVWKAAAPSLAVLAPDIYIDDFNGTLAEFKRSDNPIFIPEAKIDAGNLFVAVGRYDAIAFSPFGLEDAPDGHEIFQAYDLLNGIEDLVTSAQAEGRIRGFKVSQGTLDKQSLGGYDFSMTPPIATTGAMGAGTGSDEQAKATGYGLIISTGADEFLIVGRGATIKFSAPNARVEVDSAQEGQFVKGTWQPGRTLNGDERLALLPNDRLRVLRVKLLKR